MEIQKLESMNLALVSVGKDEIEYKLNSLIEAYLEEGNSIDLYVLFKQWQYMLDKGVELLQGRAIDSFIETYGGSARESVLGHKVELKRGRGTTIYSPAVDAMKERHKLELQSLQISEKANGIARTIEGGAAISVTLKD